MLFFQGGGDEVPDNSQDPERVDEPTSFLASLFDVSSCYLRSEELFERYDHLRSAIVSLVPNVTAAIDTPFSSASIALCWLADFDVFELEIEDGDEEFELIQRFTLAAAYYHFQDMAESTLGNAFSK